MRPVHGVIWQQHWQLSSRCYSGFFLPVSAHWDLLRRDRCHRCLDSLSYYPDPDLGELESRFVGQLHQLPSRMDSAGGVAQQELLTWAGWDSKISRDSISYSSFWRLLAIAQGLQAKYQNVTLVWDQGSEII